MLRRTCPGALLTVVALAMLATPVAAEPVRITDGYIQVGSERADWAIVTSSGFGFWGEREGMGPTPPLLSGTAGGTINLSSTYDSWLTAFSVGTQSAIVRNARAHFEFTAGSATLPTLAEASGRPDGVPVSAPFTFTGYFTVFASAEDQTANVNPLTRFDVFGSGTGEATFRLDQAGTGLSAQTVVYWFEDQAPVPEPGTMLLLLGGLAGTAARVRQRRSTAAQ